MVSHLNLLSLQQQLNDRSTISTAFLAQNFERKIIFWSLKISWVDFLTKIFVLKQNQRGTKNANLKISWICAFSRLYMATTTSFRFWVKNERTIFLHFSPSQHPSTTTTIKIWHKRHNSIWHASQWENSLFLFLVLWKLLLLPIPPAFYSALSPLPVTCLRRDKEDTDYLTYLLIVAN